LAVAVTLAASALLAPAADTTLPPDLALVPADAAGFVHIRVADLYHSEHFRELRQLLGKAGDDAIRAFNSRFVPAPGSLDRVTVFVMPPSGGRPNPDIVTIVATSAPFEKSRLLKALIQGEAKDERGNVYAEEGGATALYVPSNRLFAAGTAGVIRKLAAGGKSGGGPLAPALALAAAGKPVVAAGNTALIPEDAFQRATPREQPFIPLFRAKLVTLVADFDKGTHFDLQLRYADATAAADGEKAARHGLDLARQFLGLSKAEMQRRLTDPGRPNPAPIDQLPEAAAALVAVAALNQADEILATLPLRREGNDLRLDLTLPPGPATMLAATSAVGAGILLPATQRVQEASARARSQNNLKQIALAMHNYHSVNGALPPHAIYSKDGERPLLSWRVAILPYIEQQALYQQFKMDEPWDSPNNKPLIARLPEVYVFPDAPPAKEPGRTYYQIFVGKGAAWEQRPKGFPLTDFTDGTSNTLIIAEAAEPVIWSKPDDLEFDANKPLPKLSRYNRNGCNVAFADGSVRFIHANIDQAVLKALITRNSGEPINFDQVDK
jgi:prepilin-type processing-associated H-X9-DG protein